MELCLFCRDDLVAHCATGHPTCRWARCPRCKVTFNPEAMLAFNDDGPIPWPHTKPDL